MIIATKANFQFLGTIASTIKERVGDLECEFIEKSQDKISELLDHAAEEKLISGSNLEITEFSEDAVIAALQETTNANESTNGTKPRSQR